MKKTKNYLMKVILLGVVSCGVSHSVATSDTYNIPGHHSVASSGIYNIPGHHSVASSGIYNIPGHI
ncbi:hypothetical protein [Bacillus sp. FJAT-45037]|uniref:hypothetical protein n=1 Tax=Bacillus sp. FJAT-45037 TaxID=2011007 RepID=UPI0012FDB9F9|nr:hypothetical protein [Bacillus sp. FJAT-45037]